MRWDEDTFDVDKYEYTRQAAECGKWGFVGVERWGNINSGGGIGAVPHHPMIQEMFPADRSAKKEGVCMHMKRNKLLISLMAFILLIQPAAAVAAESGTEPAVQEQAGTEPAEGQAEPVEEPSDTKETDGNSEEGQTDDNLSGGQSEEGNPPGEGEDSQEGTAEQTTGKIGTEETETEETGTETTGTEETEATGTETEETASAAENEDAEAEPEESRIDLELPVLEGSETSPFDFIMDPQRLITETNAAKYGGVSFEEGATLYFKNTDGDYEYSHISDWLSIKSRSNIPVCVTVELTVEDAYSISFARSASFSGGECSMYLALLDSDGNETAVDADGKAVARMVLPAYGNESEAGICSFALTGCCNPDGDWSGMTDCPRITVSWTVEPISR